MFVQHYYNPNLSGIFKLNNVIGRLPTDIIHYYYDKRGSTSENP